MRECLDLCFKCNYTYNASAESVLGRIQAETNDDQEMAPKVERSQGKKYKKKNIFGGQEVCKSLWCEIVVATPGRLIDMIKMKACTLSRATYLALDEADRMFDLRFEPQIRSIVGQIRPDHQTSLCSATMPRKIEKLAREILTDPVRVTVGEIGMANEDITQEVQVLTADTEKLPWLLEKLSGLIDNGDTSHLVWRRCKSLKLEYVLVATDVAAHGLDIKFPNSLNHKSRICRGLQIKKESTISVNCYSE
ncbi:DEAD-box ATP-dependent RNA helicase 24 [Tanacetum coccineum]